MKNLIYIFSLLAFKLTAQTITPHVINSAGNSQTVSISGNTYFIASNIGEPITTTVNNATTTITQGFLQPEILSEAKLNCIVFYQDESCKDAKDGSIKIQITKQPLSSTITTVWSPSLLSCSSDTCLSAKNLVPRTYSITIYAYGKNTAGNTVKLDSTIKTVVIVPSIDACQITTYSAFSPDNNGTNDTWIITGIEEFPNNVVTIYNRWGVLINDFKPYNNKDKVWDGNTRNGTPVPNGTYFYVIELNDGSNPKKGWVEVTGK